MEKVLVDFDKEGIPSELSWLFDGVNVYDSSCSPMARVFFLDKDQGFYVKTAEKGTLRREAEMTNFFYKKGLCAEVVGYFSEESDWFVTKKVVGDDCITQKYLDNPEKLCDSLAEIMHILHGTNLNGCPCGDVMQALMMIAEQNHTNGTLRRKEIPQKRGFATADDAWKCFCDGKELLKSDVLVHGDFCLPNVMLDDWKFSAFVDVGEGGRGSKYLDFFWVTWSLNYNLRTNAFADRFFDAYGREKVDFEAFRVMKALDVFL